MQDRSYVYYICYLEISRFVCLFGLDFRLKKGLPLQDTIN